MHVLVKDKLEHSGEGGLHGRDIHLTVAHARVPVADFEEGACGVDWNEQGRARYQLLVIHIAGVNPRRCAADFSSRLRRCDSHTAKKRPQRHVDSGREVSHHFFFVEINDARLALREIALEESTGRPEVVERVSGAQANFFDAHFEGVGALPAAFTPGTPPFRPEQAAVHHVFDGGWVWVLRFNNGITSAGVVAVDAVAERLKFRSGQEGWLNVLRALPSVGEQFA